jgi:hypothetical protein
MGRPPKDIDADQVRKLAKLGCTQGEIADFLGAARSVISERFQSEFQLGSAESIISLRRAQWRSAMKGSDRMLIHLGKVYLGQTDRIDVTSKGGMARVVLVERADNPRDLEQQNGTVIALPYKDGEAVPNQETDIAPSLSRSESRQVEHDL